MNAAWLPELSMSPGRAAYGWLMLLALLGSAWFWSRLVRRDDRLVVVYLGALLGAFAGAKAVYFVAEGWRDFGLPDTWNRLLTGKSVLGALLGGYAAVEYAKRRVGFAGVTGDWFASLVPASIIVGRVGCLLHGCCLGQVCERAAWWTLRDAAGTPRWPAVPAEIAFNLLALGVAAVLRRRGVWPGQHFHVYLMAYGVFRGLHEIWRDTPRLVGPVSGYQLAALAVAVLGAVRFEQRRRVGHVAVVR